MGLIPEETIQQVTAASDIVAVISSHFPLKRAGTNFRALCPFHNERTPSFMVNPARNSFHCFGCGAGGGVIKFVELYEHVSFPDAVRRLAERAGIAIVETKDDAEAAVAHRQRKELLSLHCEVAGYFHRLLLDGAAAAEARRYWRFRGFTGDHARRWMIGYAPADPATLLEWAREKRIAEALLAESGLISTGDGGTERRGTPWFRFAGRLMFPICNEHGEVIAFSGRVLDPAAQAAKYLNSPETPLFNKGRVFFGLDKSRRAIAKSQRAIICEGQLDLITCFENGIENVVAPLGTAFTAHHARIIRRLSDEAVLCFDADGAGYKAAGRAFRELARAGVFVRAADLPPGQDPDSLIRGEGAEVFTRRLDTARPFFDFQLAHVTASLDPSNVRDRLRAVDELAPNLACFHEKAAQEDAINRAATRLAVPTEDIRRRVVRAAREAVREQRSGERAAPAPEPPVTVTDPAIRLLCRLLLIDAASLDWLRGHDDTAWFDAVDPTGIVSRLLKSDRPAIGDAANLIGFGADFTAPEQAFLSSLLNTNAPPHGLDDARAAFHHLKIQHVRGLIDQRQARLKTPGLPPDELFALTAEVVALQRDWRELKSAALAANSPVPF